MSRVWTNVEKDKFWALDKAIQQAVDAEPYHKTGSIWKRGRIGKLHQNLNGAMPGATMPIRRKQDGRPRGMSGRQWRKARDKGGKRAGEANRKATMSWQAMNAELVVEAMRRKSVKAQRVRRGLQTNG